MNETKGESHSSGVWYMLMVVVVVARAHGPFLYVLGTHTLFPSILDIATFFFFIFIPLIERKCKLIYWIKSKMVFVFLFFFLRNKKKIDEAFQAQIDDESLRIHIYEVRFCHFFFFAVVVVVYIETIRRKIYSIRMKWNEMEQIHFQICISIHICVHGSRRMNIHRRKLRNSISLQFDWLKSI